MGKGASEPQSTQELTRIATELYGNTDPLRQNLIGRSMQFLGMDPAAAMSEQPVQIQTGTPGGGVQLDARGDPIPGSQLNNGIAIGPQQTAEPTPLFNADYLPGQATGVEASPLFAALKQTTEDQYGLARDNILANTPAGGGLGANLSDLEVSRAKDMTGNIARLYQDELNRAISFATGAPLQASVTGLGNAGQIQSNMALANAQQNAGTKQALGTGAGMYFGSKVGNPAAGAAAGSAATTGGK